MVSRKRIPTVIALIEQHKRELVRLCRRYFVNHLEVFGSAATGDFVAGTSDLDFIVGFDDRLEHLASRFVAFWDEVEALFGLKADFVFQEKLTNPYLRYSIDATRETIFDADTNRETAA
jgi:predicted nucleotidyltransferase